MGKKGSGIFVRLSSGLLVKRSRLNYKNTCSFKLILMLVKIKIWREGFRRRLKKLVEIMFMKKVCCNLFEVKVLF
jgi:hypothetical protein